MHFVELALYLVEIFDRFLVQAPISDILMDIFYPKIAVFKKYFCYFRTDENGSIKMLLMDWYFFSIHKGNI